MAAVRPQNMEAYEAYFRRADLDQDGRISGSEAVAFFQGSNLPNHILAQIWKHADQKNSGFLGRPEFYNALRLVTVAQSGRELTPDIVNAALNGPAAAKIPAPRINLIAHPITQTSSSVTPRPLVASSLPASIQMPISTPTLSQTSGPRGISVGTFPGQGTNQQFVTPSNSHLVGPPQMVAASVSPVGQGISQAQAGPANLSVLRPTSNSARPSTDWLGMNSGVSVGGLSQEPANGISPPRNQNGKGLTVAGAGGGLTPKTHAPLGSVTLSSTNSLDAKASKVLVVAGNGFSSDSSFGGKAFTATLQTKQDIPSPSFSISYSSVATSGTAPSNSVNSGELDSLQSNSIKPPGDQYQRAQPLVKQSSLHSNQSTTASNKANFSVGSSNTIGEPLGSWPRMSQTDIQKYTKVFIEVDKDRDGKITGEEARNLFLSWRLPREVLKQVWDLADQDSDSMLSLREFSIALYLMERYREGRPLPVVLPEVIKSDDTLMQATSQPSISYVGSTNWRPSSGLLQQGIPAPRPPVPVSGVRPLIQSSVPNRIDGTVWASQQRAMPHLPKNKMNQQNEEHGGFSDLSSGDKKAHEQDNKIMDSKEKIEYYRSKMQELVLYKSRCDNKLNEITERASADKHEVESLAKRYEEKYKQVAEVASKLTIEDAALRDIQVRKSELQNAIVNMEKGGSADGLLQVRADRIQSELEELVKALHERCKHYGLNIKSTATIELPIGWQPGIAEGAVDWDEDWDKFEDEGFSIVKDLSAEKGQGHDSIPSNSQSPAVGTDNTFADGASLAVSPTHTYSTVDMLSSAGQYTFMKETTYDHSEYGSVQSPPGSPGRSVFGSPSQDSHSVGTGMHGMSPRSRHNDSDHGGDESIFSGNKFTDEPSWGAAFDTNDDVDSVWGFGAKDIGHEKSSSNSFYESGDFGLGPTHIDSPSAMSVLGKDKNSPFFDSVPSTPHFKSSSPPQFGEAAEDHGFNSFGRFDSFATTDSRFSPQRERSFSRFDSVGSIGDFSHGRGFSFDDSDPFGTGLFKTPSDDHSPRKGSDNWSSF